MRILITGGAGFIGSHAAEFFAKNGHDVVVFDNLAREKILGRGAGPNKYNWNYLGKIKRVKLINGDIRNPSEIRRLGKFDVILHTAAQVAVTTSVRNPSLDFSINALGTFNMLEHARISDSILLYCSTNKVYGDNVNRVNIYEKATRYAFKGIHGIPENFPTDLCEHTPYGCSKLAGDLYTQDYGKLYGLKTGIFRMSCIYGTRQFGNEEQGWIAHFIFSTLMKKPITIYGDGKQVRDVLYVDDLVRLYHAFISSKRKMRGEVFNVGGGPQNTLSLLELLNILEQETGLRSPIKFDAWRPSDQKVYISDISKAKHLLDWTPKIKPAEGVKKLVFWARSIIFIS